jgi:nucleoside-triphosphatase THEP1
MNFCDGGFVGEVRQGSERVGFEVVTLDGRIGRLASTTISRSPSLALFLFSLLSHISLNLFYLYL